MAHDIDRFVAHARQKGVDLPSLRRMLLSAGWKEGEIADAFCAHELEMPIPKPGGASSARETFLHLLAFAGLYTWVISWRMTNSWFAPGSPLLWRTWDQRPLSN